MKYTFTRDLIPSVMASQTLASTLDTIKNHIPQPRVGQLDASILDGELFELLKAQALTVFDLYRTEVKEKYTPEILLLLKLVIFKLTVWDHSATYGAKLQNLVFVDGRSKSVSRKPLSVAQKAGYCVLVVGGGYLWSKLEDKISAMSYREQEANESDPENYPVYRNTRVARYFTASRLRKISDSLSYAWSVSTLFNFVCFLYSGRYSTLILRLLKIRLVPSTRTLTRQVSFEFQNRQLVWNALTEFLVFIIPLLNLPKLKRQTSKLVTNLKSLGSSNTPETVDDKGQLYFLSEKTCAICYSSVSNDPNATGSGSAHFNTDVTNPCQCVPCGHVYCYVCLSSKLVEFEGQGWNCLRCNATVVKMKQFEDIRLDAVKINTQVYKVVQEPEDPQLDNQVEKDVVQSLNDSEHEDVQSLTDSGNEESANGSEDEDIQSIDESGNEDVHSINSFEDEDYQYNSHSESENE